LRYDAQDWDRVVDALKAADEILIICHVNPDGDALGSLLGASLGLNKLGKKTYPTWTATPPELPFGYRFLPGAASIVAPEDAPKTATVLALDCGARDRLGELLEPHAEAAEVLINVDHHPGNEDFGHLNVVVTTASSTAELVAGLLEDAGVEFDRDIATCLYTGIFTDTGSFQYTNSTPATLRTAADLLEFGVPKTEIAQQVYETAPYGYLQLVARVLGRAILFKDQRFIYSWVTHDDLRETGVHIEETDKLIDLLRSTRDADVAGIFKEQGDGVFRASLRSKGTVSVGKIARERGGGGHELAAGFTTSDVDKTVEEIVTELG
jgi:phosphoesterase RecJ-like protein